MNKSSHLKSHLIIYWVSFFFAFSCLALYVLLFLDLLFFESAPWPYASGGDWYRMNVKKTLFWAQWVEHCYYFEPTTLGKAVWLLGGLMLGLSLGTFFQAFEDLDRLLRGEKQSASF
ncbi:MAG: hypothetical protein ACFFB3_18010 [Candidatus Hodarchaeota archaeon]